MLTNAEIEDLIEDATVSEKVECEHSRWPRGRHNFVRQVRNTIFGRRTWVMCTWCGTRPS